MPPEKDIHKHFFDEANDMFVLFDKGFNVLNINKAAVSLLHLNKEDIIGKNIKDLVPDISESGKLELFQKVMKTGKPLKLSDEVTQVSLGYFRLQVKVFKIEEGLGMVITNITDLKETIDEINTFIYKLSHDMRGPITNIIGLAEICSFEKDRNLLLDYLSKIKNQASNLDYIIRKLQEQAQIRQEDIIKKLIDFQEFFNEIIDKQQDETDNFDKVKIFIDIKSTEPFYSDKLILSTIFRNLIDNAVKYRKHNIADAYVKISVEDFSNGIRCIVQDNGIGIPEEYQSDIFKMFFRANDQLKGTGLGLYTVKNAVKKLDGHIVLVSEKNKGTSFTIFLPNLKQKLNI